MKYICGTCGTVNKDEITGHCINDHDNWCCEGDYVRYEGSSDNFQIVISFRPGYITTPSGTYQLPKENLEIVDKSFFN